MKTKIIEQCVHLVTMGRESVRWRSRSMALRRWNFVVILNLNSALCARIGDLSHFPFRNLIKSLTLIGVLSFVLAISTNFIVQRNKKWELFEQNETFSHKGFVFYYGKKVLKSFFCSSWNKKDEIHLRIVDPLIKWVTRDFANLILRHLPVFAEKIRKLWQLHRTA